MLTWNNASVVSYYWPLLSSSEESSAIQQMNEKFCKDPDRYTYRAATLGERSAPWTPPLPALNNTHSK